MHLSEDRIQGVHALFGSAADVLAQRRTLYGVAVEVADTEGDPPAVPVDVLDNPAVRAHLGQVVGGQGRMDRRRLRPISDLHASDFVFPAAGSVVRLVSDPAAEYQLGPAVARVSVQLPRPEGEPADLGLLVADHPDEMRSVLRLLQDGVALLVSVSPGLASDLLPHVGVFAVLRGRDAARLGSASAREYPGLVLIPHLGSPLEVAEAIVHEAAHQKFFDLAITRSILSSDHFAAPDYRPPWSAVNAPAWQLEQCFAAWHAYTCLAVLAERAKHLPGYGAADFTLLDVASERSGALGAWLHEQAVHLGHDGLRLLQELTGRRVQKDVRRSTAPAVLSQLAGRRLVTRVCGVRTLAVTTDGPMEFYWLDGSDAAGLAMSGRSS